MLIYFYAGISLRCVSFKISKKNAATNCVIVYILLCNSSKSESLLGWRPDAIERIQLEYVRKVPFDIILILNVLNVYYV